MATSKAGTPTTGQPVQIDTGGQVADISKLLETLFGTSATTTTSPGDVTSLQQLIAQMQGVDYTQLLQSIFQQASGQIPGLQAAYGNAVGARSGGNSAVQANLNELLKQTTLAGQQQVGQLQAQNMQTQAQAGNAIASATKGTTQTTSTAGQAKELAALIGLTQAALKLSNTEDLPALGRKMGFGSAPAQTTAPVQGAIASPAATPQAQAPVMSAQAPQMSMAPWATSPSSVLGGGLAGNSGSANIDWTGGMSMAPDMGRTTMADILGTPAPQMSMAPSQPLNLMQYFDSAPAVDMSGGMGFGANDWEQDLAQYF